MNNTSVFTSTINPDILEWLNNYAKASSRTRREVLEEAIELYREQIIKINMRDDFARANINEQNKLAELGMADYAEIIKSNDG